MASYAFLVLMPEHLCTIPRQAIEYAKQVAAELPSQIAVQNTGIGHTDHKFMCLYVAADPSLELMMASNKAFRTTHPHTDPQKRPPYKPHTSLLYTTHLPTDYRAELAQTMVARKVPEALHYEARDLVLAMTAGEEHEAWVEVGRFALGGSRGGRPAGPGIAR